jgi:hypothetical protein
VPEALLCFDESAGSRGIDPVMKSDIILVGGIGTGKSTLGRLLAEGLGLPQAAADDLRAIGSASVSALWRLDAWRGGSS